MNSAANKHAISPTRQENYPEWYQQVVSAAELAENSAVRGCMVIKPWGFAIWELMQKDLDRRFKDTGHVNAYFPLFVPLSFMEKEAEHVEGFAKECAVVTHHRLESDGQGGLAPAGPLEEPLIVRPTSEAIIGATYSKWVKTWRDLPILINQWANVVRWEMRTRMFLRSAEFLWQEGHTVHETADEAIEESKKMLDVYLDFSQQVLAIPSIPGEKTEGERFPGALNTYTFEAMMQDGKALQMGTSHFLGQNFAKAFDIRFNSRNNQQELAWTTSWGVTTRMIGAVVMCHSDDDGLRLPPAIAPQQVMIIPVIPKEEQRDEVLNYCQSLAQDLKQQSFRGESIRVDIDQRDLRGGEKVWGWIKKGVPLRIEIGPRDIKEQAVFVGRRDQGPKDKQSMPKDQLITQCSQILEDIQNNLLNQAQSYLESQTQKIDDKATFDKFFSDQESGGFAMSHWCGQAACEEKVHPQKVTIRCIPRDGEAEKGSCVVCGQDSQQRVLFAKSY